MPRSLLLRLVSLESIRESVGVGHGNGQSYRWVRTPPRKIREHIHEHKHTSLNFVHAFLVYSYFVYLSAFPFTWAAGYFLWLISSLTFAASTGSISSFSASSVR